MVSCTTATTNRQAAVKEMHRQVGDLVLDDNGNVVSKITMKNILMALEPNYGKVEGAGV